MELSNRIQLLIGTALVFLLIATREYHFATWHNLPGASWAVFFLAGFYLKPKWVLPALLLVAWLIDFSAFNWGSGSDYCLTPAYLFLLPAYSILWFSGFWFSKQYRFSFKSLPTLIMTILVSAFICELLSSGSFYLFSGRCHRLSGVASLLLGLGRVRLVAKWRRPVGPR
ncbi:MAG: hypothetical protein AAGB35_06940, partial [Pseudomonadota bacterium]